MFVFENTILTCLENIVIMARRLMFLPGVKKVPIKIICKHKRRARSTIMKLLSFAKGLISNAAPKHKFGGGRRRKTAYAADTFLRIEIQKKPQLTALDVKNLQPELLQNVFILNNAGSPPEGLWFSLL